MPSLENREWWFKDVHVLYIIIIFSIIYICSVCLVHVHVVQIIIILSIIYICSVCLVHVHVVQIIIYYLYM